MKKNICKLIMPAMIAAVMISGCARQGTMPTPETPEQATPEDIEAPEPTPTLSPVFELSDKPLTPMIFPRLSACSCR